MMPQTRKQIVTIQDVNIIWNMVSSEATTRGVLGKRCS